MSEYLKPKVSYLPFQPDQDLKVPDDGGSLHLEGSKPVNPEVCKRCALRTRCGGLENEGNYEGKEVWAQVIILGVDEVSAEVKRQMSCI